jgi:hypothetical protein
MFPIQLFHCLCSPFTELISSPRQVCGKAQFKAVYFGYFHCNASSALAFYHLPFLRATPVAYSCTPQTELHTPSDGFAIVPLTALVSSSKALRSTPGTVLQHCLDIWGTNNATLVVPIVHVTIAPFHL